MTCAAAKGYRERERAREERGKREVAKTEGIVLPLGSAQRRRRPPLLQRGELAAAPGTRPPAARSARAARTRTRVRHPCPMHALSSFRFIGLARSARSRGNAPPCFAEYAAWRAGGAAAQAGLLPLAEGARIHASAPPCRRKTCPTPMVSAAPAAPARAFPLATLVPFFPGGGRPSPAAGGGGNVRWHTRRQARSPRECLRTNAGDLSMDSSSESENEGPRPVVGGKVRALARYRTHNAPRWRRLLRSLRGR